ncbi:MAG: sensor histidine kinase, partial [Microbacterium sp.]|nr:sensor histidine kinase [Microbacterium sp.]
GLDVDLDDRLGASAPSRAVQFAAYRIVQEALTNFVRHSGATHARVVLERRDAQLVVTVSDDGRGFGGADPVDAGHGGALGMRERAGLLGGSIRFEDGADGGAVVVAELPWGRAS